MRKPNIGTAILMGALLAASSPTRAADTRINMSLVVPELCTVRTLSPADIRDNILSLEVQELCNHGNYDVLLTYSPGSLKGAVADYAGRQIQLDGSGIATINQSAVATNRIGYLTIRVDNRTSLPSSLYLSTSARPFSTAPESRGIPVGLKF